jgi:beta-N-acetylhexosaminidase
MKRRVAIVSLIIITIIVVIGGIFVYTHKNNKGVKKTEIKTGLTNEQLKEQIGQMIMIGFRGTEITENSDIYNIIKDVKVGGVSLSDYDVPTKTYGRNIINQTQTKKLISDLQGYSETPLSVAVDVEGGNVNRLKKEYGFSSILSAEKMGQDKTLVTTQIESLKIAKELRDSGFNMNLAPVVDVNVNPKNPIIGLLDRSFSSDAENVFDNAKVFIQNHSNSDIIAVAKHFPGHGSSTEDTHLGLADITNTYKEDELLPYQKLNNEGLLNVVMTAHVINKNVDSNYPATLSSAFIKDILRNKIEFKGVVITDDMQMAAISDNYGFEDSIVLAINAGCDIVYFFNNTSEGYDKDIAYKVRDAIFDAVKNGKIKEERITESYNRIINLKKQFNIIKKDSASLESEKFELIGMPDSITFKEALDYAKYAQKATGIRPAFLMSILHEELSMVNEYGMCYLTDFKNGSGTTTDGEALKRVMNPTRDIPGFLTITKELKMDPYKTAVTCPMSFGWGGAMGPADFIPSTWMKYKDKIEAITGEAANPWSVRDSFLAAGLYLSESGAISDKNGEWKSAMIYFSGSKTSPYTWYADGAILIADKIQKYIDQLENNK